jgi:hypothetical protein
MTSDRGGQERSFGLQPPASSHVSALMRLTEQSNAEMVQLLTFSGIS